MTWQKRKGKAVSDGAERRVMGFIPGSNAPSTEFTSRENTDGADVVFLLSYGTQDTSGRAALWKV